MPTQSPTRPPAEPSHHGRSIPEQVAEAIRRNRAGDQEAMTDLVRIVTPWLMALARGFGLSTYSAEDVVQATLLAIVRGVDSIRDPDAGIGWLAVAARHEAIRVARAERAVEPVAEIEVDASGPPEPEAIVIDRFRQELLWRHAAE
jgi:DNA-directed RNA polymerase specialized sigma24 family protein